ncbi:LPP20 family lipoprotein [Psychrosphaera sp. 1_MG-2023]|uniref:LPP20 family lipoprotein n=1 Tax=Psychrosphaera sp. 1_MG-2023 TaxID=3062643 RepID=UPI0026E35AD4|nr:LPP20 family lipoprotein [Psychrosphaera sp. 1_MG-2023]MDO6720713.1 LPP20 family lipoprotein [Psychrosphaera sp. 1_MG-2023]
MKTIWTIMLLLLSQFGCAQSIPNWVHAPSLDSQSNFYSVGSGSSLEVAKSNALTNLALRLIVNVESETESYSNLDNGKLNQRLNMSTVQASEQLTFVKTEIIKTHVEGEETHVLVSVDKMTVFNSIRDNFSNVILPLTNSDKVPAAQILVNRLKLDEYLPLYQKYLSLLRAYQQPVQTIENALNRFRIASNDRINQTAFTVITNKQDELGLAKSYSDRLLKKGFSNSSQANTLKLTLVGPELQYSMQNDHHAYRAIGEVFFSYNGDVVLTKKIDLFEFDKDKSIAWSTLVSALNSIVPE